MPSKSDTHRKSGLYETQNSTITATTVNNNCAQDRERYGILEKKQTFHFHEKKTNTKHSIWKVTISVFKVYLPCVCLSVYVCVDP